MGNHLFIGLGETGGKILQHIKERYYNELQSYTPNNKINLEFLYIDSNTDKFNNISPLSKLQKSTKLDNSQKRYITPFNPINLPLLKRIIPDKELNKIEKKLFIITAILLTGAGAVFGLYIAEILASQFEELGKTQDIVSKIAIAIITFFIFNFFS